MARSSWASPWAFVHASREVVPSRLRDSDVLVRNRARPLRKELQEHEHIPRPTVEDPIQVVAEVAAQLPEFALDLARVRKSEPRSEQAESLDLVVYGDLDFRRKGVDRIVYRLCSIGLPVVDDGPGHLHPKPLVVDLTRRERPAPDLHR
jgi:hypothetical protein